MNGKKLQFTQGVVSVQAGRQQLRVHDDVDQQHVGAGVLRELRRVRFDRQQRSQLLRGDSEPLLRRRAGTAAAGGAAAAPAIRARRSSTRRTTPRRTSARWTCSAATPPARAIISTPRASFPKEYWNRIAFISEPTAHIVGQGIIESQGAGFVTRDGWNLLAGRRRVGRAGARAGRARRRGLGRRLVQLHRPAQPDAARLQNGKGNAYEQPLRDHSRGRIYRVVYKHAPPEKPRALA